MSLSANLRPSVLAAKQRLAEGRAKLRARHDRGSPGIQVSQAMADLLDVVVLDLEAAALADLGEAGPTGLGSLMTLVAHGGYGRRDVAPFSDVDLMILYDPAARSRVERLAERLLRDVFDAGLTLGLSVRTLGEACRLATTDITIWSSLTESRRLSQSSELYQRFVDQFSQVTRRRRRRLVPQVIQARAEERLEYGETVYLLEPNIKRSPGGLRDMQLLRWLGSACHGMHDFDGLQMCGVLSPAEARRLRDAQELLLRLRNELHFHAGKAADVLARAEQVRLAEWYHYTGREGLLPVEEFMRDYFRATQDTSRIAARVVDNSRPGWRWRDWLAPLVSHLVEGDYRVGPQSIGATRRGQAKLATGLSEILRLADLANLYNKEISLATREVVRAAAPDLPDAVSPEAAGRFLSVLSQPARVGELLRLLHDTGVLERIIPAFSHARSLLQFNEYHKFTVDEHSLRAVECAAAFAQDRGPLGRVFARIRRKDLLHLALLIHDLGKGLPGDHSEVGWEIAADVARRLYLSEADADVVKFLVHKHLVMSHLAFRRDTSDAQLVVRFAVEVGSAERLRMLFVLTAADFSAVGPGVWNHWKAEVLTDLFRRAMVHLGDDTATASSSDRIAKRRSDVLVRLDAEADRVWFARQIEALPEGYLSVTPAERIAADLRQLRQLRPGDVWAQGRFLSGTSTIEYTVATHEEVTPGIFHRLTGALSSKGLQILGADINTVNDGLILDRFFVQDPDFAEAPPESRLREVEQALVNSLGADDSLRPQFRRVWPRGAAAGPLHPLPTRVEIDNTTSERYTIIDVFAADRAGLLYTVTRSLFELGLSVAVAKIGTYLDQVVDVFYVADLAGRKIEDPERLTRLRQRLLSAIETLEREACGPASPAA